MPRFAWTDLASSPSTAFLVVGELGPGFAGGRREDDPFDAPASGSPPTWSSALQPSEIEGAFRRPAHRVKGTA